MMLLSESTWYDTLCMRLVRASALSEMSFLKMSIHLKISMK